MDPNDERASERERIYPQKIERKKKKNLISLSPPPEDCVRYYILLRTLTHAEFDECLLLTACCCCLSGSKPEADKVQAIILCFVLCVCDDRGVLI